MKRLFILLIPVLLFFNASYLCSQSLYEILKDDINIVVAKDGSGDFTHVSEAINSVSKNNKNTTVIFIKNGVYNEKVEVDKNLINIIVLGENIDSTIIQFNDYSGSGKPYYGSMTDRHGDLIGTSTSHTMMIESENFNLYNITIKNTAGMVGPAVALNLRGDKIIVAHCRILGNQDTFYTWGYGRFYIKDCFIEGAIDYIFGRGVVLFDSCIINSTLSKGYITAASTNLNWKMGYVFKNCLLTSNDKVKDVCLGRPWRKYAQTVFINCYMGQHICNKGWSEWNENNNHETCFYAEYNNYGEGADTNKRADWSHQLKQQEVESFEITEIFNKNVKPVPFISSWTPDLSHFPKVKTTPFLTSILPNKQIQ